MKSKILAIATYGTAWYTISLTSTAATSIFGLPPILLLRLLGTEIERLSQW